MNDVNSNEIRDQLPSDLDVSAFVGPYQFPDNSRRRIPGYLYLGIAGLSLLLWLISDQSSGLVNDGFLVFAIALAAFAVFVLTSSWKMTINERDALVHASRAVEFAVGHASAQQVWRGVRSRPTWRVFCYSAQEPPTHRGLVLVDAVDGEIVECLVEINPDNAATSK
ncbi:MAG: hypothetical protein RL438_993 [Actinomycetota bacterium]